MPDWPAIFTALRRYDVAVTADVPPRAVSGGDISAAWCVETGELPIFLKTTAATSIDMFEAEAAGLEELCKAEAVRVPTVIACNTAGADAFLAMEWITFEPPAAATDQMLGRELAVQHRRCMDQFGWYRDNTIGATPQHNRWSDDWVEFFRDQRLGYQLHLAASNGFGGELQTQGALLSAGFEHFFAAYQPAGSLLHGDLWAGNWAASEGRPVIFDPAVYYGDRESDIAMTRLFGGFGAGFYRAYEESWPLAAGHEQRIKLYQLYHILNHLNLFGRSYLARSLALIRELNRAL